MADDWQRRLLRGLPDATVVARAPGRVNIIGEHTDYNGFPVLPMAIDRSVQVAVARRPGNEVVVRSVSPERYAPETVVVAELADRPARGTWVDYVVAAARCRSPVSGLEVLVDGDVPPAAGLSSSSALVVASLLALGPVGDRAALAEEARQAERYVGTLSGGMDQAIALLAEPGRALRIEFRPVRVAAVIVPADIAFVVAHSGVEAAKSRGARDAYNERVRECLAAAAALGVADGGLLADVPAAARDAHRIDDLTLRRRAGFVFDEAARVDAATDALQAGELARLGSLLDESHAGLRDEYEVSHPTVDRLVEAARTAGAAGARVVGAGFGGCIVAVCGRSHAGELRRALGPRAWIFEPAAAAERHEL